MALADHFDVAIIDLNLKGHLAYPVADELMRRGVPTQPLFGGLLRVADGAPRLRHEGPLDDRVVGTRILPALRAA